MSSARLGGAGETTATNAAAYLGGRTKPAIHCLLPHVCIYAGRNHTLFFLSERGRRKTGEHFVKDKDLHIRLRLLFFPKAIKICQPGLDQGKQLSARL